MVLAGCGTGSLWYWLAVVLAVALAMALAVALAVTDDLGTSNESHLNFK